MRPIPPAGTRSSVKVQDRCKQVPRQQPAGKGDGRFLSRREKWYIRGFRRLKAGTGRAQPPPDPNNHEYRRPGPPGSVLIGTEQMDQWIGDARLQLALLVMIGACVALVVWRSRVLTRSRLDVVEGEISKEHLKTKLDAQQFVLKGHELAVADLHARIEDLSARQPERELEAFDAKRPDDIDEPSINRLGFLYDRLAPILARCAGYLGEYELSLSIDDENHPRLARAQRLLRTAAILGGGDQRFVEMLNEVQARLAAGESRGLQSNAPVSGDLGGVYLGTADSANGDGLVDRLNQSALALYREGWYHSAMLVCRRAGEIARRRFGPQDPRTLKTDGLMAMALGGIGRHREAEDLLRTILDRQTRALGRGHPDTMRTRHSLVGAIGGQGRHAEAEAQLRRILAEQTEALGAEHPETLTTRHKLAGALFRQRRHAEAESVWWEVLASRERLLGGEHPETLKTRSNLARSFVIQGRYGEAQAMWAVVLAAQEKVLGRDHPETLATRLAMARALGKQGRLDEAEAALRDVLAVSRRVLGSAHPHTIEAEKALADLAGEREEPQAVA